MTLRITLPSFVLGVWDFSTFQSAVSTVHIITQEEPEKSPRYEPHSNDETNGNI